MKRTNKYHSLLKEINNRFENKNFEHIVSNLTLEELIIAKLELSTKGLNEKLFGYPLYNNIQHITKESLVRFALRFCNSQEKAANLLGLDVRQLKSYISKHGLNINKGDSNE